MVKQKFDTPSAVFLSCGVFRNNGLWSNVALKASQEQSCVPLGVTFVHIFCVVLEDLSLLEHPLENAPVTKMGRLVKCQITQLVASVNNL